MDGWKGDGGCGMVLVHAFALGARGMFCSYGTRRDEIMTVKKGDSVCKAR